MSTVLAVVVALASAGVAAWVFSWVFIARENSPYRKALRRMYER